MRAQIIAEVSTNHGGSITVAQDFIRECADAGADYVKFQSYQVKHLRRDDPQYAWFQQCELSDGDHDVLMHACAAAGVKFLTTVFNAERVPFLKSLGLDTIKIGSGEAQDGHVFGACLDAFPRVMFSLGLGEHEGHRGIANDHVAFHCVSLYPTPVARVQLQRIQEIDRWADAVGWSDHCVGIDVCKAAIAMGAQYIEKHVTLPYAPRSMAWDATMAQIRALRDYAEFIDMITSGEFPADLTESRKRFIGRWQATEATVA